MNYIIETKELTRKFGNLVAVDRVNLQVKEGEIYGFLGPNGAGKTTTITMLITLLRPTSGSAVVAGYDLAKDAATIRSIIGVVPQTFSLFEDLTAEENLWYIGKLYGMKESMVKERAHQLLKIVALSEHKSRISGGFSGGMKQRLSVAAGLMSQPKILFMDEPTTGLDPQSRVALRDLTKELNKQGITIFYTTHDMEEAEKLCDRIAIMDKGKIIALGTSNQIKQLLRHEHLVEIELEQITPELVRGIRNLPFVTSVVENKQHVHLKVRDPEGVVLKLSQFFLSHRYRVREIRLKEPSLEDVFMHLTKKALRD